MNPSGTAKRGGRDAGGYNVVADDRVPSDNNVRPLARPDDPDYLTAAVVLVRSQLEVFACTRFDMSRGAPRGGVRDGGVSIGRVGIRCVHCGGGSRSPEKLPLGAANAPGGGAGSGAASFPRSLRLVYQATRNWQRYHLGTCPHMPGEVREQFEALKRGKGRGSAKKKKGTGKGRSGNSASSYWEEGLIEMGLIDTDRGIRLREGGFADVAESGTRIADDGKLAGHGESDAGAGAAEALVKEQNAAAAIGIDIMAFGATTHEDDLPDRKRGSEHRDGSAVTDQNGIGVVPQALLRQSSLPVADRRSNEDGFAAVTQNALPNSMVAAELNETLPLIDRALSMSKATGTPPSGQNAVEALLTAADEAVLQISCPSVGDIRSEEERSAAARDALHGIVDAAADADANAPPVDNTLCSSSKFVEDLLEGLSREAQDPSAVFVETARHQHALSTDAFTNDANPANDSPTRNEALLRKVQLAVELIRVAALIRPMPQQTEVSDGVGGDPSSLHTEADLTALGVELYELFSGQDQAPGAAHESLSSIEPLSVEDQSDATLTTDAGAELCKILSSQQQSPPHSKSDDTKGNGVGKAGTMSVPGTGLRRLAIREGLLKADQNDAEHADDNGCHSQLGLIPIRRVSANTDDNGSRSQQQGQRRKRERRRDEDTTAAAGETSRVPLVDLGVPAALCCVVSSLLEYSSNRDGDNDRRTNDYESIDQVEEDLRLIAAEPRRYLFHGDTAGHLRLSDCAMYGRGVETTVLLGAFEEMTSAENSSCTNNMVLISGYSGTGKSALMRGVESAFAERGACYVMGKFDAMRQPRPLSAIASALDDYCAILSQDADRIDSVKQAVQAAIGSEGGVLAGLIPNLRNILSTGEEDSPVQITGREAFQRTIFLFRMLFWATCSRAHPVVLFLDDLQWADEVSLELMRVLVTDTMIEGLLFVGSYRDNEVGDEHPLTAHLDSIRRSRNVAIVPIHMTNLDSRSVNHLVSDALHLAPRTTRSLAGLVSNKTGGNALFAVQFLACLYDEGLLHFSLTSRRWEWDIDQIRNKDIADNVVELMTVKLLRLAPEVQDALSVAASFGATCQESSLRIIDRSPDRTMSTVLALDVAVTEGLMVKLGSVYRFSHDQIQHAAYLLIPETARKAFHLKIGRLLWEQSSAKETEVHLCTLVDQLHRGSSLITDKDEKVMLTRLSLMAGEMATALSSFLPAASHLKAAVGLLCDDDWLSNRELCFDVYNLCAETENVVGDFDAMQEHVEKLLAKAETLKEKVRPYYTLVRSLGAQGRLVDAINVGVMVINQLGEKLPVDVTGVAVKQEILMTARMLSAQDEDSLMSLKTMECEEEKHVMNFLHELNYHAYIAKKSYFPVPVCRLVRLSLSHGVCRDSAVGFSSFGVIQCVALGNFSEGYRYGKLALSILDRFQAKDLLAKVYSAVYGLIYHWTEPSHACLPPLKHAIEVGLATGDTERAMILANQYVGISFGVGKELGQLCKDMKMYSQQMMMHNQYRAHQQIKPVRQAVLNLLGHSANPIKMAGDVDELYLPPVSDLDSIQVAELTLSACMWLEYMFGKHRLAWETNKRRKREHGVLIPTWCYDIFYSSLTALALARIDGETQYIETIDKTMAQMAAWAKSTPWNCQNKLELMKAEYAYLKGDFISARKCFELSIELAVKHRFIHEQALALERLGVFHLEVGEYSTASIVFTQARHCYEKWGALAKVAHIEEQYP